MANFQFDVQIVKELRLGKDLFYTVDQYNPRHFYFM